MREPRAGGERPAIFSQIRLIGKPRHRGIAFDAIEGARLVFDSEPPPHRFCRYKDYRKTGVHAWVEPGRLLLRIMA